MDVLSIVKAYLDEHGYDGLASDNCGCGKDDLAPCGVGDALSCKPARTRVLGADEYIGDCGPGETCYIVA